MKPYEIAGYTFQADLWCPECIVGEVTDVHGEEIHDCVRDHESTEGVLDCLAKEVGIERGDENSFDSDDFPKVVLAGSLEEDDFCSGCWENLG